MIFVPVSCKRGVKQTFEIQETKKMIHFVEFICSFNDFVTKLNYRTLLPITSNIMYESFFYILACLSVIYFGTEVATTVFPNSQDLMSVKGQ